MEFYCIIVKKFCDIKNGATKIAGKQPSNPNNDNKPRPTKAYYASFANNCDSYKLNLNYYFIISHLISYKLLDSIIIHRACQRNIIFYWGFYDSMLLFTAYYIFNYRILFCSASSKKIFLGN